MQTKSADEPLFNLEDSKSSKCMGLVRVAKRLKREGLLPEDVVLYYPGGDVDLLSAMIAVDASVAVGTSKWSVDKLGYDNSQLKAAYPVMTSAEFKTFSADGFFSVFLNALVKLEPKISKIKRSKTWFYIDFSWNKKRREIFYYLDLDYFKKTPPVFKSTSFNALFVEMHNPPEHVQALANKNGRDILVIDTEKSGKVLRIPYCTAYLSGLDAFTIRTYHYRIVRAQRQARRLKFN